jgi:hypothetical protein
MMKPTERGPILIIVGSVFTIWLSFFGGKSIREYFMDKSGAVRDFFAYVGAS